VRGKTLVVVALTVVGALLAPTPATARATDMRLSYKALHTETGTKALDGSGHGNNGKLRGGVTRVHGVYRFHPLSRNPRYDRIQAPDAPSLNPGRSPFTYSVRLKVSPNAEWSHSEMAVIRHGDSDAPGGDYKMELRKNPITGTVSVFCVIHDDDGVGAGYIRGRGGMRSIADGHWHTITCARVDADTVSLTVGHHTVERATRGDLGRVVGDVPLLIGCQLRKDKVHRREQFVGMMDDITVAVE
jgi:hypothetical protein